MKSQQECHHLVPLSHDGLNQEAEVGFEEQVQDKVLQGE